MDKLTMLYGLASDSGINVHNAHFSETKKAVCLGTGLLKNIILDKSAINSRAEEGAILSEEIGHFETGALYVISSTYNMPVGRSNRLKYEATAKHWAYRCYLPPDEIQRGFDNEGYDDYAVAEYCGVTLNFLHNAIVYYHTLGIDFHNPYVEDEG